MIIYLKPLMNTHHRITVRPYTIIVLRAWGVKSPHASMTKDNSQIVDPVVRRSGAGMRSLDKDPPATRSKTPVEDCLQSATPLVLLDVLHPQLGKFSPIMRLAV